MKRHFQRVPTSLAIILCFFLATALPTKAETDSNQDGWKFGGAAYLWAAEVKGTSVAGVEIDVSSSDLISEWCNRRQQQGSSLSRSLMQVNREKAHNLQFLPAERNDPSGSTLSRFGSTPGFQYHKWSYR